MRDRDLNRAGRALCFAAVLIATPSWAADVDNGRRIAFRWCQPCHVVASTQRQASDQALPFAEIAEHPGFNPMRVATFLLDPHPKMPDMSLTREETADLAAYIGSLAKN